jgi:hypothetical protein
VLSKNGLRVNDIPYPKGSKVLLESKASLRIGGFRLFFTVPRNARPYLKADAEAENTEAKKAVKPKLDGQRSRNGQKGPSYGEMVYMAFKSGKLHLTVNGTTQRDIIEWICSTFEGFKDPTKRQNLTQGVYMTLTKGYQKYDEIVGEKQKRVRWRMRSDVTYGPTGIVHNGAAGKVGGSTRGPRVAGGTSTRKRKTKAEKAAEVAAMAEAAMAGARARGEDGEPPLKK